MTTKKRFTLFLDWIVSDKVTVITLIILCSLLLVGALINVGVLH